MIGTKLAHYEITAHLGSGGMGEVYQATDLKLKRSVAIKLLPTGFAADSDRLCRFRREAQVLASLNHPNIAHIYDLEESGDQLCIAMELVDGETLQARLKLSDSGQQLIRYYGAFANARRVGVQAPAPAPAQPDAVLAPLQDYSGSAEEFARGRRRSWARLIKKVYEADPLVCPRCSGPLKIISLIGDAPVIEKILRQLKLWDRPERPPRCRADRSIQYDEESPGCDETGQWPDAAG